MEKNYNIVMSLWVNLSKIFLSIEETVTEDKCI